jgi:hypothetical protein
MQQAPVLLALVSLVSLVSLPACSSKSTGSSADAGTTTNNAFTCGGGSISGTGRATDPTMGLAAVPGATISSPGCTTAVTDDRGYVTASTDPGLMMKIDLSNTGYLNEHAEFAALQNGFAASGYMYPESIKTTILTGWDDAQGYIAVVASDDGSDAGACATADGVTLSVKGHPEIHATYLKDQQTADPSLTVTSSFGGAVLGPIPPGTYEVDGAKTGCTSSPTKNLYFQFNTTIDVSAGVLTLQEIVLVGS